MHLIRLYRGTRWTLVNDMAEAGAVIKTIIITEKIVPELKPGYNNRCTVASGRTVRDDVTRRIRAMKTDARHITLIYQTGGRNFRKVDVSQSE